MPHFKCRNPLFFIACLCFFISGCASVSEDWRWDDSGRRWMWAHAPSTAEPTVTDDGWIFGSKEVNFQLEAMQRLNSFNGESHTVVVKVFQLSDPGAFNKLLKTSSGIRYLLTTEELDPSILFVDRLVIEPNASRYLSFDRQEGARYVAIVAGFVGLNARNSSRLIPIVGMDDNLQESSFSQAWTRWFGTPLVHRPAKLSLEFWLGSDSIEKTEIHTG